MLKNDFEKYMKNNLESARWDWDKEEMWNDIEQHLPPVKKPKRILPIWWITGLLSIGLVSAFLIISNLDKNATAAEVVAENQNANSRQEKTILAAQDNDLNKQKNSLLAAEIPEEKDGQVNSQNQNVRSIEKNIDQPYTKNQNVDFNSNLNINNTTSKSIGELKSNSNSSQKSNLHKPTTGNILNNADDAIQSSKKKNDNSSKSNEPQKKSVLEEMIDRHNSTFAQSRISSLDYLNGINSFLFIPVRNFESPTIQANDNQFVKPSSKNWVSSLTMYSNYSLLNRTLTNTLTENLLYDKRLNSEQTLEGIGAQLNYRVNFNRNVFAEVGVEYQRINEVMNFQEEVIVQEVVPSDSAFYFVNFMGETQFVTGERTQRSLEKTAFNSYNEHHFVNVPLHIGYSKDLGRFALNLISGPVLNVYQSYKGDSIGEDLTFVKDTEVNNFNNSLLSAFDVAIYLDYGLTKNLSLSSGINYRKSLSSFTIDGVVNQSYDVIDFKLGILFKI